MWIDLRMLLVENLQEASTQKFSCERPGRIQKRGLSLWLLLGRQLPGEAAFCVFGASQWPPRLMPNPKTVPMFEKALCVENYIISHSRHIHTYTRSSQASLRCVPRDALHNQMSHVLFH
jgi:hypothetical protein